MKPLNFQPFPAMSTQRLTLRRLEHRDAEFIYCLRNSEENQKYLDIAVPSTIDAVLEYIEKINKGISENKYVYWVVEGVLDTKGKSEALGTICLWHFDKEKNRAEIGYELYHTAQKQGFMTEAMECVFEYAKEELELSNVEAYTQEGNKASKNLLERFEFRKVGELEEIHSVTKEAYILKIWVKAF